MEGLEHIISAGILVSLIGIGVQDFKYFAISWIWIPVLVTLGVLEGISILPAEILFQDYTMNLAFLGLQIVVIFIWFSFRQKKLVNLNRDVLGWGDILFLMVLAFYFSFVNYLIFVIGTTLLISISYLIIRKFTNKSENRIPLAGAMALCLLFIRVLMLLGINISPYSNQYLWIV